MKLAGIFGVLLLLSSCSSENNALRNDFISDIENKADTDGLITTLVDTDFEWQLMYDIPDSYSEKTISDIIGFEWNGPAVPDQHFRYLFVDTISRNTDYFDYSTQEGLPQVRFLFDNFSTVTGNQVSYIYKKHCIFKSYSEEGSYWNHVAYSINYENIDN